MKTQRIGASDLNTSCLSYGCMRISGAWNPSEVTPAMEERGIEAVFAAYEAGYTLFDHADIYGQGTCESIFGKALKRAPSMRQEIVIATKCGIRFAGDPDPGSPHRFDFSASHIVDSCEKSLRRLGIETIDLYQLHRPDFLANPPEIAEAFDRLQSQGKVRWFGVSNYYPWKLTALQKACPMPLVVNQVEIHLARLDCFTDGTLDQCLADGVTPLSWSPLAGGLLGDGGQPREQDPRRDGLQKLLVLMDEMAAGYGVSRTVLALAWLLKHPSGIVPIVGSVKPERISDAVRADDVELSRDDWYKLLVAARMEPLP